MARKQNARREKPYIIVFCEGETEEAYVKFIQSQFKGVCKIKAVKTNDFFKDAKSKFDKEPQFRNKVDVTDEIWFLFDTETKDIAKWDERYKIIKDLRKLRPKPGIRVRLLMTSGCIEYWFVLHYKLIAPSVQTEAEKKAMEDEIKKIEPAYYKGSYEAITHIAKNSDNAIQNAKVVLYNLTAKGLPTTEDNDERNKWLCQKCETFSTVFEALEFLKGIQK